jgi:hypothetical protein
VFISVVEKKKQVGCVITCSKKFRWLKKKKAGVYPSRDA